MIVKTGRFGQLSVGDGDRIFIPQGVFGFPDYKEFCLIDLADDTLILWLQSLTDPGVAFALLEPKIFKPDYTVSLSASELRELKLDNINQSAVLSILTIPEDITKMSANLKAPLVINLKEQIAKQVILQENEYNIKHEMFQELRRHLVTIESQRRSREAMRVDTKDLDKKEGSVVAIQDIPPSLTVKTSRV